MRFCQLQFQACNNDSRRRVSKEGRLACSAGPVLTQQCPFQQCQTDRIRCRSLKQNNRTLRRLKTWPAETIATSSFPHEVYLKQLRSLGGTVRGVCCIWDPAAARSQVDFPVPNPNDPLGPYTARNRQTGQESTTNL